MPQNSRVAIRVTAPLGFPPSNGNNPVVPAIFSNGKRELHVNTVFAGYSITWTDNVAFVRGMESGPKITEDLLDLLEVQELRSRHFLVELITE